MNDVLKRIEILRIERDLSAKQIIDSIGIDKSTYSTWKSKDRTPDANNLVKIARFFNVSTDYLLTGEGYDMPDEHKILIRIYEELNEEGQTMLLEYGEYLSTKYIKSREAKVV